MSCTQLSFNIEIAMSGAPLSFLGCRVKGDSCMQFTTESLQSNLEAPCRFDFSFILFGFMLFCIATVRQELHKFVVCRLIIMALRPAKQRRQEALREIAGARISENQLGKILSKLAGKPELLTDISDGAVSSNTLRNELADMHLGVLERIGTAVNVPLESGGVHQLVIASPQAMVSFFVERTSAIKDLMESVLLQHHDALRLCMYHDEVSGGNVLRPDNKRKVTVIYFSFLEFGSRLLRDELVWFPMAVIKHDTATMARGALSGVLLCIFKVCFSKQQIEEGFLLRVSTPRIVFFRVSNILADEAALKATWSHKGASGIKPCLKCKNVLMKGTLAGQASVYLVEITEDNIRKFDQISDAEWFETADALVPRQGVRRSAKDLDNLEKSCGLNYNAHGLLFDPEMRKVVPPSTATYDSMHTYFNHGIASNETHVFLERAQEKVGLTYAIIHKYISTAGWAASCFLQKRINPASVFTESRSRASKEALKSMASELLAVLPLLRQLVLTTLSDKPQMQQETASFLSMCTCVDILQEIKASNAPSVELCNKLRSAQREHLRLHMSCYGTEHVRPKNHYSFHIPDQIARDTMLLDAFTLERKHKLAKRFATTVTNGKDFETSVLARLLSQQLQDMPDNFCENHLLGSRTESAEISSALGIKCMVAEKARCQHMLVSAGDILFACGFALQVLTCLQSESGDMYFITKSFECFGTWGHAKKWRPRIGLFLWEGTLSFSSPTYWKLEDNVLYTLM